MEKLFLATNDKTNRFDALTYLNGNTVEDSI